MSARFKTFPELKGEQALAADPAVHAALSASAGTGKTQVLTARVLRLLLQGRAAGIDPVPDLHQGGGGGDGEPHRRAARGLGAAARTASWRPTCSRSASRPIRRRRERARQLFAKVLDCPGGLKIQTIHSFAQSLLAAFPAEAGIVPGFQPIEGRAEQELVRRTLADLMADAEAQRRRGADPRRAMPQPPARRGRRGRISAGLRAQARSAGGARPARRDRSRRSARLMDLPDESVEDYIAHHCGDDRLRLRPAAGGRRREPANGARRPASATPRRSSEWLALTPIERARGSAELAQGRAHREGHAAGIAGPDQGRAALRSACRAPRGADRRAAAHPERRAARRRHRRRASRRARPSPRAYTQAKRAAGVADFNDLIDWTRRLLDAAGHGRLGALQARPPGRPCAGRRGAGHQCRAVGDHRAAGRGIFQRLERERASGTARCSWSATSSRRSTASRAPIRERFQRGARGFQAPRGVAELRRRSVRLPSSARASSATCRSPPASARRSRCSTSSTR